MTRISNDELRTLIRETIVEILPGLGLSARPNPVTITNNDQLNDFVQRLCTMIDDPVTGPLLRNGQLHFHLDTGNTPLPQTPVEPAHTDDTSTDPVIEINRGVLTERIVNRAVTEGAQLLLGTGVVITPLARERLRKSAVVVKRS